MIKLPQKNNVSPTEIADPLKFYYMPVSRGFYIKRLEMAASLIRPHYPDRLLDAGCGSGIFLKELETLCQNLTAIDLHRKMDLVHEMTQKERINANLCETSVTNLPFRSEAFDGVVSVSVLEHIKALDHAFSEIDRVAKSGAVIVLGFPVKNIITDFILRASYKLLPNVELEDEHVSDHIDIIKGAKERFGQIYQYHFPSFLPLSFSAYCILKIIKK